MSKSITNMSELPSLVTNKSTNNIMSDIDLIQQMTSSTHIQKSNSSNNNGRKRYGWICPFIFCIVFPLVLGGCLFGIYVRTCPNVWNSKGQGRFTQNIAVTTNTTTSVDISTSAFFSDYIRFNFRSDDHSIDYRTISVNITQSSATIASLNNSTNTKIVNLKNREKIVIESNQNIQLEVTPIRQSCPKTTGGAIVLLLAIELVIAGIISMCNCIFMD